MLLGLIAGGSSPGLMSIVTCRTTTVGCPGLAEYVTRYVSVTLVAATPCIVVIDPPFPALSRLCIVIVYVPLPVPVTLYVYCPWFGLGIISSYGSSPTFEIATGKSKTSLCVAGS